MHWGLIRSLAKGIADQFPSLHYPIQVLTFFSYKSCNVFAFVSRTV